MQGTSRECDEADTKYPQRTGHRENFCLRFGDQVVSLLCPRRNTPKNFTEDTFYSLGYSRYFPSSGMGAGYYFGKVRIIILVWSAD